MELELPAGFWHRKRQKKIDEALFDCPDCKSTQRCARIQLRQEEVFIVFPTSSFKVIDEFLRCERCGGRFSMGDYQLEQSSGFYKPVKWACPKCGNLNPNITHRCTRCHYSLL